MSSPGSARTLRGTFPLHQPFVGRTQEQQQLRDALDSALAGDGRVALIAGEPGIGKSALAHKLLAEVDPDTALVLTARCSNWEGSPPYWPWICMLRQYMSVQEDEPVLEVIARAGPHLVQILPELTERGLKPVPHHTDPDRARFELCESINGVLRAVATTRLLVLFIDDLHWADSASLSLLQYLLQQISNTRILAMATYRPHEAGREQALVETLAAVSHEPGNVRIELAGLSRKHILELWTQSTPDHPGDGLLDDIVARTGGNPFFATELLRMLTPESGASSLPSRVPESVRDVVRDRVSKMPSDLKGVIEMASGIGREFGLPLLARVADRSPAEVANALYEAVLAGLIEEGRDGPYRFRHDLVRESVYADLTPGRRMYLHARIGESLESGPGGMSDHTVPDLAYHFGVAAPLGFAAKAAGYAIAAAELANRIHAWETSIEHYQRAIAMLDLNDSRTDAQYIDVLTALANAQTLAGEGREQAMLSGVAPDAMHTYRRVIEIARAANLPEHFARAVLGLAGPDLSVPQARSEGISLMQEALDLLPESDSSLRARLLARHAADAIRLWNVGDLDLTTPSLGSFRRQSDAAVEMAKRLDDQGTLAFALLARQLAFEGLGLGLYGTGDTDYVVCIATSSGNVRLLETALSHRYFTHATRGAVDEADSDIRAIDKLWPHRMTPQSRFLLLTTRAGRALRLGRMDEAETLLAEAVLLWPKSAVINFQVAALRWEQERITELADVIRNRRRFLPRASFAWVNEILLLLDTGDIDGAKQAFDEMAAGNFSTVLNGVQWLRTMTVLAIIATELKDANRARSIYQLILPFEHLNVVEMKSDQTGGSVSYYLGLTAATMEEWELAEQHYERAIDRNTRWRNWMYLAYTQFAWASMLIDRGCPEDEDRSRALFEQARTAADQIGMPRLQRLIRQRYRQSGATAGLTVRELEVLRLVVSGRTDREIGAELFISHRTVSSHVASILAKLDAGTRTEAAAAAIRAGIV